MVGAVECAGGNGQASAGIGLNPAKSIAVPSRESVLSFCNHCHFSVMRQGE